MSELRGPRTLDASPITMSNAIRVGPADREAQRLVAEAAEREREKKGAERIRRREYEYRLRLKKGFTVVAAEKPTDVLDDLDQIVAGKIVDAANKATEDIILSGSPLKSFDGGTGGSFTITSGTSPSVFATREEWFADLNANPNGRAAQEQRVALGMTEEQYRDYRSKAPGMTFDERRAFVEAAKKVNAVLPKRQETWVQQKQQEVRQQREELGRRIVMSTALAEGMGVAYESPEVRLRREIEAAPKVWVTLPASQLLAINGIEYRVMAGGQYVPKPFADLLSQSQRDRAESPFTR